MVYAYAAVFTIGITAAIILFPMWRRGGREALIASSSWTIPLFAGLIVLMVLLAIALQQPASETVVVILAGVSATFAAYRLIRDDGLPRWIQATFAMIVVLGLAITIVVLLGGLR